MPAFDVWKLVNNPVLEKLAELMRESQAHAFKMYNMFHPTVKPSSHIPERQGVWDLYHKICTFSDGQGEAELRRLTTAIHRQLNLADKMLANNLSVDGQSFDKFKAHVGHASILSHDLQTKIERIRFLYPHRMDIYKTSNICFKS